jgi:hypothetical protein
MPRPSPSERRRIEARKKANEKIRLDAAAHEERVKLQVEQIISGTLARTRGREATLPDLPELLERLEEARLLAMASGQANAAVAATMAEAKLCGFVIDKSQSAVAIAGQIAVGGIGSQKFESIEDIVEDMREHLGDRAAQKFLKTMEVARRVYDEDRDATDDEIRQIRNGGANGVEHD